ncbi:hypothetical protein CWI39_0219p0060 [Hamiltosporidium magnivora]|uniref:Uncharacterized protein n=1 Tax=Hamiltosporidium magnivora TaxID=148818 RepID=A0A4Q9LIY7_9MICR|nr:hypothetical protein CWI39_0219p0060 [Hamiltosporidium magnivora]
MVELDKLRKKLDRTIQSYHDKRREKELHKMKKVHEEITRISRIFQKFQNNLHTDILQIDVFEKKAGDIKRKIESRLLHFKDYIYCELIRYVEFKEKSEKYIFEGNESVNEIEQHKNVVLGEISEYFSEKDEEVKICMFKVIKGNLKFLKNIILRNEEQLQEKKINSVNEMKGNQVNEMKGNQVNEMKGNQVNGDLVNRNQENQVNTNLINTNQEYQENEVRTDEMSNNQSNNQNIKSHENPSNNSFFDTNICFSKHKEEEIKKEIQINFERLFSNIFDITLFTGEFMEQINENKEESLKTKVHPCMHRFISSSDEFSSKSKFNLENKKQKSKIQIYSNEDKTNSIVEFLKDYYYRTNQSSPTKPNTMEMGRGEGIEDGGIEGGEMKNGEVREVTGNIQQENTIQENILRENTIQDNTIRDNTLRDNTLRDNTLRDNTLRDNTLRDNTLRDNTLRDTHPPHTSNNLTTHTQETNQETKQETKHRLNYKIHHLLRILSLESHKYSSELHNFLGIKIKEIENEKIEDKSLSIRQTEINQKIFKLFTKFAKNLQINEVSLYLDRCTKLLYILNQDIKDKQSSYNIMFLDSVESIIKQGSLQEDKRFITLIDELLNKISEKETPLFFKVGVNLELCKKYVKDIVSLKELLNKRSTDM